MCCVTTEGKAVSHPTLERHPYIIRGNQIRFPLLARMLQRYLSAKQSLFPWQHGKSEIQVSNSCLKRSMIHVAIKIERKKNLLSDLHLHFYWVFCILSTS